MQPISERKTSMATAFVWRFLPGDQTTLQLSCFECTPKLFSWVCVISVRHKVSDGDSRSELSPASFGSHLALPPAVRSLQLPLQLP